MRPAAAVATPVAGRHRGQACAPPSGRRPAAGSPDGQIYQYGGTPLGNAKVGRLAQRAMIHWLRGDAGQV